MKVWALILLLGVWSPHWTETASYNFKNYILNIENQTLKSVTVATYDRWGNFDLSQMNIKHLEENVFDHLRHMKNLDMSNNQIEVFPTRIFFKLDRLETLSLAKNKISDVKGLFFGSKNLRRVDLSNNNIKKLNRGDLFGLPESANIIIGGNKLELLSSGIFQDPSVAARKFRSEYYAYYEISSQIAMPDVPLPDDFEVKICTGVNGTMKSVEYWTKNEKLGDCIRANIDRMRRRLDLVSLGLRKFERGWYKLRPYDIYKIDLSYNNIVNITSELLNDLPPGVSTVDFTHNNIKKIRENVIENRYINTLILDDNFIRTIEDGALGKTNLTTFRAATNDLDDLTFLDTLPAAIECLTLSSNEISEIPIDAFKRFKNLRFLDLNGNSLETVEPGTFGNQKNLLELHLASNRISRLHSGSFKGLKAMKFLNLSDNGIKRLSRRILFELRNLKDLKIDFKDNEIDFIGKGSFSHFHLVSLDLSDNDLTDESIEIGAFNPCRVQKLALRNNFFTEIDSEIFSGIPEPFELNLHDNLIRYIKNGDTEYLGNVSRLVLNKNPVARLENGALYGLSPDKNVEIHLQGVAIEIIQTGLFDEWNLNDYY